jgi:anthranilate/para-aminobenzoate synthase component II
VQFHPESFLTVEGPKLLKNFLEISPSATSHK